MQQIIHEFERRNRNPQAVWLEQLKQYVEIPAHQWPMPEGYRSRVAPQYFSKVYSVPGRTATEYGERFLEEHGLKGCTLARGLVDALSCADRLLLEDGAPNLVNTTTLETLARKAYAIELGFGQCRSENDWRKPRNAKEWTSKVDWEMVQRMDPAFSAEFMEGTCMQAVRDELRLGVQRDVEFSKVRSLAKAQHAGADPLNAEGL